MKEDSSEMKVDMKLGGQDCWDGNPFLYERPVSHEIAEIWELESCKNNPL